MKNRILPFFLILILFSGLAIYWGRREQPDTESVNQPTTKVVYPITDAEFKWEASDGETMIDLVDQLSTEDMQQERVEFSAILKPGEELVVEGLEVEPGVFEFTRLTPAIHEGRPDEESTIKIKSQRFTINLDGQMDLLTAPTILMRSGSSGSISVGNDEVEKVLDLQATLDGDNIHLEGATSQIRR